MGRGRLRQGAAVRRRRLGRGARLPGRYGGDLSAPDALVDAAALLGRLGQESRRLAAIVVLQGVMDQPVERPQPERLLRDADPGDVVQERRAGRGMEVAPARRRRLRAGRVVGMHLLAGDLDAEIRPDGLHQFRGCVVPGQTFDDERLNLIGEGRHDFHPVGVGSGFAIGVRGAARGARAGSAGHRLGSALEHPHWSATLECPHWPGAAHGWPSATHSPRDNQHSSLFVLVQHFSIFARIQQAGRQADFK